MRLSFIDPGAFRTELQLESASLTPDGFGGHTQAWAATASVFARIEPVSAKSLNGAGQTLETVTHRIAMRHRADVSSGMRLTKPGRVFEIVTAHDPDETGRYLICMAREDGR